LAHTLTEERLLITDCGPWFCYASGILLQRPMAHSGHGRRAVRLGFHNFHVSFAFNRNTV